MAMEEKPSLAPTLVHGRIAVKDRKPTVFQIALAIFCIALVVRLLLFFTVQGALRNDQAGYYGSVAVAIQQGWGLTFEQGEIDRILDAPKNHTGDYLKLRSEGPRQLFTEYLPGPAVLLSLLWSLTGIHTFAPLVLLQILIDSISIALLYVVLARHSQRLALATCLLLVINLASIKRTLMVGYDFWPQVEVLAIFMATLEFLERRRGQWVLWAAGGVGAIIPWFRDITSLLPFVIAAMLIGTQMLKSGRRGLGRAFGGSAALLAPVMISLLLMSVFRYETTGSFRPTRSTLWHTVMCGIGQFPNPYGLSNNDQSIWEYGKSINPSLSQYNLDDMYRLPGSPYETTLKAKATEFMQVHPVQFVRNIFYRIGIMISPFLYRDGDFLPPAIAERLFPLGFCLFPLWIAGMIYLFKKYRTVFLVAAAIYVYFFVTFGWLYVNGRLILAFSFQSMLVYLLGLEWLVTSFWPARKEPVKELEEAEVG